MAIENHVCVRYTINETTRLSMSSWEDNGIYRNSVTILRLTPSTKYGKSWMLDDTFIRDFASAEEEDGSFRATDYAAQLVASILGECPLRFFRDNAIDGSIRQRVTAQHV